MVVGDRLRELFRRQLGQHGKELSVRPVSVVEENLQVLDGHGLGLPNYFGTAYSELVIRNWGTIESIVEGHFSSSSSTASKRLPSRSSRLAPPPVLTCVTLSARPIC